MGNSPAKQASDQTARALAKIRHIETILNVEGDEKRLFEDPYAEYLYPGSSIVKVLVGKRFIRAVSNPTMGALMHLLVGRTREFDERVRAAVAAGAKQLVVLGAGFDTRGFRLGLPAGVAVFEVDQPDVQAKKRAALEAVKKSGMELPGEQRVHFVPCDFNVETIQKLRDVPGYDPTAATVFTLEGVTQYIQKEATAGTLAAAAALCGPGSSLVISYVPQDVYDAPEKCTGDVDGLKAMLAQVARVEPWITGWSPADFASLLAQHGFQVKRDISIDELIADYYQPACREVPQEYRGMFERYVLATKG